MEQLVSALGPAFAVGLALQALVEWLDGKVIDPIVNQIYKGNDKEERKKTKSGVVRTIAIVVGCILAWQLDIKILGAFEQITEDYGIVDTFVSGLIISLGTDGINQVVKFVEKAKGNQDTQTQKAEQEMANQPG